MKPILGLSALAFICVASSALAQDCIPTGDQAQNMTPVPSQQGMMMCRPTAQATPQQGQQPQQQSGMCPCCRNMAMMRQHHGTPEQPKH